MKKLVSESVHENLKKELIDKLMQTVYNEDDPKYDYWNYEYLNSLSIEQLDQMLSDYYMYDIQRDNRQIRKVS